MLDQLLSEMNAVRWQRRPAQSISYEEVKYYELCLNGSVRAYMSVASENAPQEQLLKKMLSENSVGHG